MQINQTMCRHAIESNSNYSTWRYWPDTRSWAFIDDYHNLASATASATRNHGVYVFDHTTERVYDPDMPL